MPSPVLIDQFGAAAGVVGVIELVKRLKFWPFSYITAEKTTLLRLLAVGGVVATSVGFSWHWDATSHTLTLGGLTISAAMTFVFTLWKNAAFQETVFQLYKKAKNGNGATK